MSDTSPIVDPSPTAAPIHVDLKRLDEVLAAFPAPASDAETLALEPNTAAGATSGPHDQPSQTAYVHMTKSDGSEFLAPKANVDRYVAKGFTAGAEEDIPDLVAYWAARATAPAEPTPATSTRSTSIPSASG